MGRGNQTPRGGRGALPRDLHAGLLQQRGPFRSRGRGRFGANSYAPGINAFNALMAKWREKGDLEGLELG